MSNFLVSRVFCKKYNLNRNLFRLSNVIALRIVKRSSNILYIFCYNRLTFHVFCHSSNLNIHDIVLITKIFDLVSTQYLPDLFHTLLITSSVHFSANPQSFSTRFPCGKSGRERERSKEDWEMEHGHVCSRWIILRMCRIIYRRHPWSCFHRPGGCRRLWECKDPSIHKLVSYYPYLYA